MIGKRLLEGEQYLFAAGIASPGTATGRGIPCDYSGLSCRIVDIEISVGFEGRVKGKT